jgi:ApaG protein
MSKRVSRSLFRILLRSLPDPPLLRTQALARLSPRHRARLEPLLPEHLDAAALATVWRAPAPDSAAALEAGFEALRLLNEMRELLLAEKRELSIERPCSSDTTTRGLRVEVESRFVDSKEGVWRFAYRVKFTNAGDHPVQLATRSWRIQATGRPAESVFGPGVVGQHPKLLVGESHTYESSVTLTQPTGRMWGAFTWVALTGEETFEARVAPFALRAT